MDRDEIGFFEKRFKFNAMHIVVASKFGVDVPHVEVNDTHAKTGCPAGYLETDFTQSDDAEGFPVNVGADDPGPFAGLGTAVSIGNSPRHAASSANA